MEGLLSEDEFLTNDTAEGLRMTLTSTLDSLKYLVEDLKIEFVLTGRINPQRPYGCKSGRPKISDNSLC